MTNINNPYGFIPVTPNAKANAYTILTGYGTAINIGDPVVATGTGLGALAEVNIGVAASPITGVFAGCSYTDSNGQPQWGKSWPASTTATNIIAYVYDDPFTEFRVQSDGTFAVADYFNKAQFTSGAGTNGISGYVMGEASVGTGTDLQIRRLFNAPDNAVGLYSQVVVGLRLHTNNYPYTGI